MLAQKFYSRYRKGVALLLALIFVALFATFAVSLAAISGTNVQIANNQSQAGGALTSAYSGLEVLRYYLSYDNPNIRLSVPGSVSPANRLQEIATRLNNKGFSVTYTSSPPKITVNEITLNSQNNQTFSAVLTYGDTYEYVTAVLTGHCGEMEKKVAVNYNFGTIGNSVFDFGIATKGPLKAKGSVEVEGLNERVEASVYIESLNSILALDMIGKSSIAGDVSIVNTLGTASISSQSSIAGEKGSDAMEYVHIGVPPCDFPNPNPGEFEPFVQNTFHKGVTPTSNVTLQNIRIPANTNPSFSGNCVLKGVIFIEQPNIIKFNGNTQIIGVVVGNGSLESPSSSNNLEFLGTLDSRPLEQLPNDPAFNTLKTKTGTFLIAPGFNVSFSGNFDTVNGAIAASGISFSGNSGGKVKGSVINYSDNQMVLDGNTNLIFNRSGTSTCPAGFGPSKILVYDPNSYSEPIN